MRTKSPIGHYLFRGVELFTQGKPFYAYRPELRGKLRPLSSIFFCWRQMGYLPTSGLTAVDAEDRTAT